MMAAAAVTLTCADGSFDGLQLRWMLERTQPAGEPRKCVLITGPRHLHLVDQRDCTICAAAPAVARAVDQGELAQYFVPLEGGVRSRHLDFFKRHGAALRDPELRYLLPPRICGRRAYRRAAVTYLGVSHLSPAAVDDLLALSERKFHIDCEANRLNVAWESSGEQHRRHIACAAAEQEAEEADDEEGCPAPKRQRQRSPERP